MHLARVGRDNAQGGHNVREDLALLRRYEPNLQRIAPVRQSRARRLLLGRDQRSAAAQQVGEPHDCAHRLRPRLDRRAARASATVRSLHQGNVGAHLLADRLAALRGDPSRARQPAHPVGGLQRPGVPPTVPRPDARAHRHALRRQRRVARQHLLRRRHRPPAPSVPCRSQGRARGYRGEHEPPPQAAERAGDGHEHASLAQVSGREHRPPHQRGAGRGGHGAGLRSSHAAAFARSAVHPGPEDASAAARPERGGAHARGGRQGSRRAGPGQPQDNGAARALQQGQPIPRLHLVARARGVVQDARGARRARAS
mmetsp:Transcript_2173/g.7091  ORF Transcript_2173/g.7091 Transcript_2173/m.7091 type:complete len:313 (+) Transcript_2173:958-1896(+)